MKTLKRFSVLAVSLIMLLSGCAGRGVVPSEPVTPPPTEPAETALPETAAETTAATTAATAPPTTVTEATTTLPPEPEYYTVRLICAGDNLIHSSIYNQAKRRAAANGKEGYDFGYVYERVEHYIKDADLAILNQETIVTDELEPSDYPRFCSPADLGEHMIDIGFDVFSMSNNHILDRGEEGLLATLRFWDSHEGIVRYGAYRDEEDMNNIRTLEVNGITFAFLGYMEHTNGLKLKEDSPCKITYLKELELIEEQVRRADEIADVVVVSPHFGKEISNDVTESQKNIARLLVDWGADIIIGTQPHTVQTMEYIEREDGTKAFCFYCLGNFVSAQENYKAMVGMLGELTVTKNSLTGEISLDDPGAIPIITQYGANYYQVHIVPYCEYTDEELNSHGSKDFSRKTLDKVLSNIPEEYLRIE